MVGTPFLDLTLEGLPRLPVSGEEVTGRELHLTPGGTGMQAVAAARLGLRTTLVSPIGRDLPARLLGELFQAEGVEWLGPPAERSAVTAILRGDGAPAMATFHPPEEVGPEDVASAGGEAVVLSLGRLQLRPPGASAYVVTGPGETGRFGPSDLDALAGVRAVVMNEREALDVTGAGDAASAARVLAEHADVGVVTRGPGGAVGAEKGNVEEVPSPHVSAVDTTGAGDVFVAAYVWADRQQMDLATRLRWATLYASLSTTAPTAFAGSVSRDELLRAGRQMGLTPPASDSA